MNATTVVLCREKDPEDANYRALEENRERLQDARLADGSKPEVVDLPMPAPLVFDGRRLPASYANFYIANAAVLVPTFNDPNDRLALGILAELFRDRPGRRHPRRRPRLGPRHAPLPDAAAAGPRRLTRPLRLTGAAPLSRAALGPCDAGHQPHRTVGEETDAPARVGTETGGSGRSPLPLRRIAHAGRRGPLRHGTRRPLTPPPADVSSACRAQPAKEATMGHAISRRGFMTAAAGAAVAARREPPRRARPRRRSSRPARRSPPSSAAARSAATPFPSWPVVDEREEKALLDVLHSGKWYRGDGQTVSRFEEAYARLTGARHCIATANGTSALYASLAGLDVAPGDEVILPPYTFVATLNVVFLQYALPVFVDSDPETFQMDARKLEGAITERTAVIMPVHLGGNACDLDAILEIAGRRKVPVLEDACQAHLGEWRGRKLGTLGAAGCFSFQASKNLNSGEGGAILTSDDALAERCWAFHDNARARRGRPAPPLGGRGANLRLTEFQAGLLLAQMTRLEEQSRAREENARYLTQQLREIPGILPGADARGLHPQRLPPLHVPLPGRAVRRAAPGAVPEGALGRGHPVLRRLHAAQQAAVRAGDPRVARLPAGLPAGGPRGLGGAQPLPGQRPALRGGRLAHADHAPRAAAGHGRHRRRGPEDPRLRRRAGEGVRAEARSRHERDPASRPRSSSSRRAALSSPPTSRRASRG